MFEKVHIRVTVGEIAGAADVSPRTVRRAVRRRRLNLSSLRDVAAWVMVQYGIGRVGKEVR